MIIALIADTHGDDFSDFSVNGSRFQKILDMYAKFRGVCKKYRVERVIHLGDVFQRRGLLDVHIFNATFEEVEKSAEICPWIIIPGNHDIATKDGMVHSLSAFSRIRNVTVVDTPRVMEFKGRDALFLPYTEYAEEYLKRLRCGLKEKPNMIFTHVGVHGAMTGSGEHVPKEPITPAEFKVKTFSGHYHSPQTVGNVTYVGAPMEHRNGEYGGPRGVVILNTDTMEYDRVEFDFPRFIKGTVADLETREIRGHYVTIEWTTREDRAAAEKMVAVCPPERYRMVHVGAPTVFVPRSTIKVTMADKEVLTEYVKNKMNRPLGREDERLIAIGEEIMTEATTK